MVDDIKDDLDEDGIIKDLFVNDKNDITIFQSMETQNNVLTDDIYGSNILNPNND